MSAFKQILNRVLGVIFPIKGGFDFSTFTPDELLRILPKSRGLRGAIALTDNQGKVSVALSYRHKITRAMIWSIKFKKDSHALACGGYILYHHITELLESTNKSIESEKYIIIPMPSSPARRRERGYNQCELLAHAVIAYDVHGIFTIRNDILFRKKNVEKQTFKNRNERLKNMKDVFDVHCSSKSDKEKNNDFNKTYILLDDVITTGSTLREAILCLEKAGFNDVRGLGLAH